MSHTVPVCHTWVLSDIQLKPFESSPAKLQETGSAFILCRRLQNADLQSPVSSRGYSQNSAGSGLNSSTWKGTVTF